jgi:GT2 family glycosyltransferase
MSVSLPSFAAVVVIHDSAPELRALLKSLERHLPARPELIVVGSGSRDEGAALAREHGADVVSLPGNPGFGPATNAGIARVRADVTALLNPDVQLLDAGLLALVARARERDVLAVPRLLDADGAVQRSAHPVPGRAGGLLPALVHPPLLPRALRLRAEPWRASATRTVGWAIAACLVARTATLRALGPFDPGAFLFFEDMDLCLRARAAGIPTELHPAVAVHHAGGHATARRFGGEPHELLAHRRREVVRARLGGRALALDDAAQALTFATRVAARALARRDTTRPRAQLRALRRAQRAPGDVARGADGTEHTPEGARRVPGGAEHTPGDAGQTPGDAEHTRGRARK